MTSDPTPGRRRSGRPKSLGFYGVPVDPTPNVNYTVEGGEGPTGHDTPETVLAAEQLARDVTGIGLGKFESQAFDHERHFPTPPEPPG